ncbi:MAG: radical SAM protein [Candidatus Omnitrophota bacterium]
MKIGLLNVSSGRKSCINKDFMGGYGWAFNAGKSLPARMINVVKRMGENLPIMSFAYIASIFHSMGHTVQCAENRVPKADLVFIQSSMVEHTAELAWARRIRKSGAKAGFIGPFSGAMPDLFINDCDFIIKGEPESAAFDIAKGHIPKGLIESRAITDLDTLPFPRWDFFPYRRYSYFPAIKEKPFLPVLASRGCPFSCSYYCPYPITYAWRQRSSKNVLDEIGELIERYGMKAMLFRDPIFTADRARTVEIMTGILERGYTITWACETRLDKLDKELIELMRKAGMRVINVGIESYDEDVVKKASRKPIALEHQEEIVRYCDELGIRVTAFYMFGMPDDTEESLFRTIRYAKKLNTHVAQFFIFTPFPGTKYYQDVAPEIYEKEWEKFDCYTPVFRHKNLTPETILRLKERAFVSYYYRPQWAAQCFKRLLRDISGR